MKKTTKKHISHLALAVAMLLAFGVPVSVAAAEAEEAADARAESRYVWLTLSLYNGVTAYSASYENTTNEVCAKVTDSTCSPVSIGTYDASYNSINVNNNCSVPGTYTIKPAHLYPGQNIRLGIYKNGISGNNSIKIKYYYNGI